MIRLGPIERRIASGSASVDRGAPSVEPSGASIATIGGTVVVYGVRSKPIMLANGQRFRELIEPGAFAESIRDLANEIRFYVNHFEPFILARRGAGTLTFADTRSALHFGASIPPTSSGRDLVVSMERGDVDGSMSWGMNVYNGGDVLEFADGMPLRRVKRARLFEITMATAEPTYSEPRGMLRAKSGETRTARSRRLALTANAIRMQEQTQCS